MILKTIIASLKRQEIVLRVTCLFWLFTKIISFKTWIADRMLPTVSFLSFLDKTPSFAHLGIFIISTILLVVLFLKPKPFVILAFLFFELSSVVLDAIRLQPWEYLYLWIFLLYFLNRNSIQNFSAYLLVILSSTYVFSGVHKLSTPFLYNIWDRFILLKIFKIQQVGELLHNSGLLIGIVESGLGILLLTIQKKCYVIYGLITMHLLIFIFLGLVLGGSNYIVLPWNLLMICFLIHLLNNNVSFRGQYSNEKILLKGIMVLFWFVLPTSNLFGYWAHYLSSGLYTGKTPKAYLCVIASDIEKFKAFESIKKVRVRCTGGSTISLYKWVEQETGVVPFPELWYYSRLTSRISDKYNAKVTLFYSNRTKAK